MTLANGFMRSRVMLTAVELDLFTALSGAPATESELRQRLGLHPRGTADFLDVLVALELLERDGDRYRNAPAADYYLDKNKPSYLGYPEWVAYGAYHSWTRFTDSMRTGLRQSPRGNAGGDLFDLFDDPAEIQRTMQGADAHTGILVKDIIGGFNWADYRDFVDIGGARGTVAAMLVKAFPQLSGVIFDLPVIEPYFAAQMAALGVGQGSGPGQVRFQSGDFFTDPMPVADVAMCGHTLHNHSVATRKKIIGKAFDSLRPGGAFLAYDVLLDDERRELVPLMWGLSMLVQTAEGSEYTFGECRGWLQEAGFGTVDVVPLTGYDKLVIARKDG
jgi:SAM-dependent methyltransferase